MTHKPSFPFSQNFYCWLYYSLVVGDEITGKSHIFPHDMSIFGGEITMSSGAPRAADGSIAIETVNYSAVPHPDVPPMKWQDWAQQRAVQDLELKVYCTIYTVMCIYMCLHIVILYYM
jgi:hypothetical protein